jgi:cell volume regulation protein A
MAHDPALVALLAGAAVLLVGISAVRVAHRTGVPSLLAYLAVGLLIGEAGLGVQFEDTRLTERLGFLALALILIEGGLTTRWAGLRPALPTAGMLSTVGLGVSVLVVAGAAHAGLGMPWRTALLLGAVVAPTDAAAVFATLRGLPLRRRPAAILEAESGTNDPLVVILVLTLSGSEDGLTVWRLAGTMAYQVAVGALVGAGVATIAAIYLRRVALPSSGLYPLAVLAFALAGYSGAAVLGASGFVAAYLVALALGNMPLPHRPAVLGFVEGVGWLAQIGLFVMLGLLASPARLPGALPAALLVGTILLLLARPLAVLLSCLPTGVPLREQVFLSWGGLRGAVPIVLATVPITAGVADAERIFDIVFLLVLALTAVQAPTLAPLARALHLVQRDAVHDLAVESAPLERLDADLLEFRVPARSELQGVRIWELMLPETTSVALLVRDGKQLVPDRWERLRADDQLLVVTARGDRRSVAARLATVARHGPRPRTPRPPG